MRRFGLVGMALVLCLALVGVGHAHWTKNLYVDSFVQTGTFEAELSQCEPYDNEDTKGVATPTSSLVDADLDGVCEAANLTITGAYPCYEAVFPLDVHCLGTVPLHVYGIDATADNGWLEIAVLDEVTGQPPALPIQLHQWDSYWLKVVIHVAQEDDAGVLCPDGETLGCSITINTVQYNEGPLLVSACGEITVNELFPVGIENVCTSDNEGPGTDIGTTVIETVADTSSDGDNDLFVARIDNGYPSYEGYIDFDLQNYGYPSLIVASIEVLGSGDCDVAVSLVGICESDCIGWGESKSCTVVAQVLSQTGGSYEFGIHVSFFPLLPSWSEITVTEDVSVGFINYVASDNEAPGEDFGITLVEGYDACGDGDVDTLSVTIFGGYYCYVGIIQFDLRNYGSVPAEIASIDIVEPQGGEVDVCLAGFTLHDRIDPGGSIPCVLTVHIATAGVGTVAFRVDIESCEMP